MLDTVDSAKRRIRTVFLRHFQFHLFKLRPGFLVPDRSAENISLQVVIFRPKDRLMAGDTLYPTVFDDTGLFPPYLA